MKAVALTRYLPVENPTSLVDIELEKPIASAHDLLVRIEAIGVNPLDGDNREGCKACNWRHQGQQTCNRSHLNGCTL